MKKALGRVVTLTLLLTLSALILGCGGRKEEMAPEKAALKRELRVAFAWPTYIDPAVGSDFSSSSAFVNLYDTLVYPTAAGGAVPHIAERWESSPDGLTWTFYLRQGVKFHDGSELKAEDVAFSMDRIIAIGEGYGYLFADRVKKSEAVDDYTVRFHMAQPYGPFLTTLARLYLLNKEQVLANIKTPGPYGEFGDYGKEYLLTHDCGSGAYMVKEMRMEEYLLMERFPDYWGKIVPNAAEELRFIGTTEAITIRTMMSRGELEISDQWQSTEALAALDALEEVEVATLYLGTVFYYMIHTRKPPTDDIHFRKAIALAMDYDSLLSIFPGSRLTRGPIPQGFPGYNPDISENRRDLDRAKSELKQSKYYDQLDQYPVEVNWVTEVPDEEKAALLFMSSMQELGIKVNIVKTPWLSLVEATANQESSPNIATIFVSPHYAEAGSLLESRYHSKSAPTWEQNEWLLDPEIDGLIDQAISTIDQEKRFKLYRELQQKLVGVAPSLPLFEQAQKHAYQAAYIDWPAAKGRSIPVMGYDFDARLIMVYPEKKPQ